MPLEDRLRRRTSRELREERDELGFVRQPEVRWLSPAVLTRSGVEVLLSAAFGKFADKRELQTVPQEGLDYSADAGELWVDYLSGTGDGFDATYTMAWLLAQESLDFEGETLPRGRVLILAATRSIRRPTRWPTRTASSVPSPPRCRTPARSTGPTSTRCRATTTARTSRHRRSSSAWESCARRRPQGSAWGSCTPPCISRSSCSCRAWSSTSSVTTPSGSGCSGSPLFAAGAALGSTVFAAVLLAIHRARGATAWGATNEVFSGQSIADYKNLLRMRLHRDGGLTIYPLGVERVGRRWRYERGDGSQPRFAPGGPPPAVEPIDVPLRTTRTGAA